MKEHSRPCCVLATKIITTKWTDPTKGQTYKSTKWMDPTKGQTYKSTKWTDPTRVKLTSPQSGRIPQRVKHISPQSGRTQPGSNLQVHKVDGSHQGSTRFTKWTAPTRAKLIQVQKVDGPDKGQTYITPKKRTDPTNVEDPNTHNGWTQPVHKIIQVHKVDGRQGSRPHSTE